MQVFLRRHPLIRWLYQFSFDGENFYSVTDKDVVRLPPYEPLRKKLNRVLVGATESFDGCYCKTTKALAIIAVPYS